MFVDDFRKIHQLNIILKTTKSLMNFLLFN